MSNRGYRGDRNENDWRRRSDKPKKVYGTEQDPNNCSFFLRVGACRHGDNCPKKHNWPTFSNTLLFEHIWIPSKSVIANKKKQAKHYENFLEDILQECQKWGDIIETCSIANTGDHMIGNTFVKFGDEEQAQECLEGTKGRYYAGRKVKVRYSPITDFDRARCRDYVQQGCKRGNFCNFGHFMELPLWAEGTFTSMTAHERFERAKRREIVKEKDNWPAFPKGGSEESRIKCIEKWNILREKSLNQTKEDETAAVVKGEGTNFAGPTDMDIDTYKPPTAPANSGLNLFLPGKN